MNNRWSRTHRPASKSSRRGNIAAMTYFALFVLLGMAGLAIDMSLAFLACQQCQVIADAGALAGSQELPQPELSATVARQIATLNLPPTNTEAFDIDTNFYAWKEEIPDVGPAPLGGGLRVTATKQVDYVFLKVLGMQHVTVSRHSTATKVITGTCIAPLWIWHTTPVSYGLQINLLMASAPNCGVPGSFGFLQPQGGVDFQKAMAGLIAPDQEELQRVDVNDYVYAYTGLAVDHWRGPLKTDKDSRLNRSSWPKWSGDTFNSFHADNPRLLIVPMVEYISGTGNGAYFLVHRFACFWLEDVITNGVDRYIQGRFLDFSKPGGTLYGLKPGHLVR